MPAESVELASTQCCIAARPGRHHAGLLLARAGVDVLVLEKHADFFRDFRDTSSTLELCTSFWLRRGIVAAAAPGVRELAFHVGRREFKVADFSHLGVSHPFIV